MAAGLYRKMFRLFPLKSLNLRAISTCRINLSSDKNPGFNDERVKSILKRLTGCDPMKVFSSRQQRHGISLPKYKLMTDEELLEEENRIKKKAEKILKMPPVMEERQEISELIDVEGRLEGYDTYKYVFTDVSMSATDRNRRIVVREPNGELRSATWEERDIMNFIYFPKDGREWEMPEMLTDEGIHIPLSQNRHEDILDLACVQCEPDSKEYIQIHQAVYKDIDENRKYELLWSTRHFGGLVYHLVKQRDIDNLLEYYINKEMYDEAGDLVRLYYVIHPKHFVFGSFDSLAELDLVRAHLAEQGSKALLKAVEYLIFLRKGAEKSS